jgi:hypothetical protein
MAVTPSERDSRGSTRRRAERRQADAPFAEPERRTRQRRSGVDRRKPRG